MLTRAEPALFIIVGHTPGGALAVPATSARAAAQAARHLTTYCPHTQATWQVNPHAGPGQAVVFGRAHPPAGEHLLDHDAHAFLLVPGEPLPPIWVALCGHQIVDVEFEALDPGMGRPCPGCHQRWAAAHDQHTALPVRSPGAHMQPQLRGPLPASRSSEDSSST
ncbi:MAG: hypothetical protein ACRDS1_06215 [Pseudonocardiaceae bacterium]